VRADDSGARYTRFAGYALGQQDLSDVQSGLGPSTLKHVGEAGNAEFSICYALAEGTVSFESGELGGPSHVLLGFDISSSPPTRSCAQWPASLPEPALQLSGLRIGMPRSAFNHRVGSPISWHGDDATVSFHTHGSAHGTVTDVLVTIEAVFEADRLRSLKVWRTETT
jgi:hypothetical protein